MKVMTDLLHFAGQDRLIYKVYTDAGVKVVAASAVFLEQVWKARNNKVYDKASPMLKQLAEYWHKRQIQEQHGMGPTAQRRVG